VAAVAVRIGYLVPTNEALLHRVQYNGSSNESDILIVEEMSCKGGKRNREGKQQMVDAIMRGREEEIDERGKERKKLMEKEK
jgi:hypothetical protein